jgi:hypothetical protein
VSPPRERCGGGCSLWGGGGSAECGRAANACDVVGESADNRIRPEVFGDAVGSGTGAGETGVGEMPCV